MKTIAPLQMTNLFKSFSLLFFIFSMVWALTSYWLLGDVFLSLPLVILTLLLSAFFGWRLYKRKYHATLSYDPEGFDLQVGRERWTAQWREYERVSLFHLGFGVFSIRLYKDGGKFVEIPVSSLKLDPSRFRFEAMEMIRAHTQKRPGSAGED